jgi:alpha-N-acetylglucosamine transferase
MKLLNNTIFTSVIIFITTIVIISTLQWIALQIYNKYCSPQSMYEIFYNMFSLGSPVCYYINTIQYELSKYYVTLWTSTIAAFGAFLVNLKIKRE